MTSPHRFLTIGLPPFSMSLMRRLPSPNGDVRFLCQAVARFEALSFVL